MFQYPPYYFKPDYPGSKEAQSSSVSQTKVTHPVSETFLNFEYYKCFAMRHLQFQFFAIFVGAVPNHSMRFRKLHFLRLFMC